MNRYFQLLFLCHRLPSRSFFYRGVQFPICARCTGICIGYIIGIILALFKISPFFYALILTIPMIIDGTGQLFNKWLSTNNRRLVTGILGGIGIVFMILHATLLFWNLTMYLYKKGEYIGSLIFN
ncbi:DUF2085 domain-containing protein [Lysinibacillus xylanilyticus]|uniref:DUF2085 domain-containing protein n=1 Tax=Lysinibacillus xylanilyticus TaxID=582475 RepID=UPI002B3D93B4|nr:DUF2085 domain-containing protein [Lysinibacillus xylanilyticus]